MLVMGLDTALQRCSVAILQDGAVLAEQSVGMERGHAEHLASMTLETLQQASKAIADFDRIGVVVGPGGFTGVRVGLSFARGLVIGTRVQAVGVTSLAALAGNVAVKTLVAPVIDARRGQVYAGLYDSAGKKLIEPFVAEPEQALKKLQAKTGASAVMTVGSGAALLPGAPSNWSSSGVCNQIDAKVVARLAEAAAAELTSVPPSPLYLRPPDAKPPKPGRFANLSKT